MNRRTIIVGSIAVFVTGALVYVMLAAAAQRRAQSMSCANAMVSACFAARMWAEEHDGKFPTNFICMSNEAVTPKILSCVPARRARTWSDFRPENSTYEIVTPGVDESATNTVFLRCTIHGHLGYTDMTVFDGARRRGKSVW